MDFHIKSADNVCQFKVETQVQNIHISNVTSRKVLEFNELLPLTFVYEHIFGAHFGAHLLVMHVSKEIRQLATDGLDRFSKEL